MVILNDVPLEISQCAARTHHVAIGIFNVVLTRVVNYPVHVERYIAIHSYIAFSHAKPISM
jgi:hypothetical protein